MAYSGPMFTDSEAPEIICPKCGHVWEVREWVINDVLEGDTDETQCPQCKANLVCDECEVTVVWTWGVAEETKS